MGWTIDRDIFSDAGGAARYEQIASVVGAAIDRGDIRPGERLPTVRALARQLGVSSASVAVAYRLLERQGRVDAQVGRGTFVRGAAQAPALVLTGAHPVEDMPRRADVTPQALSTSWRRRALYFADRLRAMNPHALVCDNSWPDPTLLPVDVLRNAFHRATTELVGADLQYSGPEAHPDLVRALLPRLAADGVPAEANQVVVLNSLVQTVALLLQVAPAVLGTHRLTVAVEEPGFQAVFNVIETLGHDLAGMQSDADGVLPEALRVALERGANVALLTPRALNPTGASWSVARRAAVADILAEFPHVLIVEDDHFAGLATHGYASLLQDERLADRTVYARSFSKSLAPDLRTTIAVVRGRLGALLRDARLHAGGWSSRLSQRALAHALSDPALDRALEVARGAYARRRAALIEGLLRALPGAGIGAPRDGLNVWLRLPAGSDAVDITQNAAHLGVLVSSGESFYLHAGHREAIRLSVGHVSVVEAERAGELAAQALLTADELALPLVV